MRILEEIYGLVSSKIEVLKNFRLLLGLEARLARLSILPFLISAGFVLVLLFSSWLSFMVLASYALFLVTESIWIAVFAVVLLNLILLLFAIKFAVLNLKNMSFIESRKILQSKGMNNHVSTSEVAEINCQDKHGLEATSKSS